MGPRDNREPDGRPRFRDSRRWGWQLPDAGDPTDATLVRGGLDLWAAMTPLAARAELEAAYGPMAGEEALIRAWMAERESEPAAVTYWLSVYVVKA